MNNQIWSYLLTIVGITGFILAGKRVWWCWYINIACQVLWFTYAIVTQQYGFIIAALLYTAVFTRNAIEWTKGHRLEMEIKNMSEPPAKPEPMAVTSYEAVELTPVDHGRISIDQDYLDSYMLNVDVVVRYLLDRGKDNGLALVVENYLNPDYRRVIIEWRINEEAGVI